MALYLFRVLLVDLLNCSQHCTKLKSRVDSANAAVVIASARTIVPLAVALVRDMASWPSVTLRDAAVLKLITAYDAGHGVQGSASASASASACW